MTKEIWAAVIIAIIQIIVSVLIAGKQINVAKELANPEQKHEKPKKNLLSKIFEKCDRFKPHITIPFLINAVIIIHFVTKNGFTLFLTPIVTWVLVSTGLQIILEFVLDTLLKLSKVQQHIMKRLLCHVTLPH